ncbi:MULTISPECIES: hypothetical protein, partial [unclassified Pseudomonas]|uniref:hypothetical protein n=1 Tax=unclassified Pseudomonas TaxID=196821 RepID=UPI001C452F71
CRTPGQKPFGSFLAFEKGTRCKSETASGSTRSNGYTPNQQKTVGPKAAEMKQTKNGPHSHGGRFRYCLRRYRKTALICGLPAW